MQEKNQKRNPFERIDRKLEKTSLDDFVFSAATQDKDSPYENQWEEYAMERLRWFDADGHLTEPEEIKNAVSKIVLLNGYTATEALDSLDMLDRKDYAVPINFQLGREKAFLDVEDETLYIAQPVSKKRGDRFADAIYTGCVVNQPDWNVDFVVKQLGNDKHKTIRTYDDRAYCFLRDVSLKHNKLRDIEYVTLGPIKWMKKHTAEDDDVKILEEHLDDDYIKHMITEVNGKKVLNIDYVFSDQAEYITKELLTTYFGETDDNDDRAIHILMYGKVGGISDAHSVTDLVTPNGIIAESDINRGKRTLTEMENVLRPRPKYAEKDYILNANSVPLQKKSMLRQGVEWGCTIVEMEALYATQAINNARSKYENLNINQGFIGFVSDTPLKEGEITLANGTREQLEPGMKKAVNVVVDYVKNN